MITSQPLRIGITGSKGSGKDTVAAHLMSAHFFNRVGLADPMKEMLHYGLGIPMDVLHGAPQDKEAPWRYGKSVRQLLQTLGTEWGREIVSQRLWLDRALEHTIPTYEGACGAPCRWVVTDVRYLNEAEVLRAAGFQIVRINRPRCTGDGHASETEMAQIEADHTLTNDDTLDALYQQVDTLLSFMEPR
jgi:hypothetical protein